MGYLGEELRNLRVFKYGRSFMKHLSFKTHCSNPWVKNREWWGGYASEEAPRAEWWKGLM